MARRGRPIPLLVAMLAVLLPLILLLAGAVIWQGYRKSIEAAMGAGGQMFQSLQTEIAVQQQQLFEPLRFLISTFAEDPGFGAGASDRYLAPFMTVLERYPHVSGFRVGYDTGELFEVTAFRRNDPGVTMAIMAPSGAAFAVHAIDGAGAARRETWRFFDADRAELTPRDGRPQPGDARASAWYTMAKAAPAELVETFPYVLPYVDQPGISVAKAFYGFKSGVIAADVTLMQLSASMAVVGDEREQAFLFYDNGKLLAHPDPGRVVGSGPWSAATPFALPSIDTLSHPVARALVARFRAHGGFGLETLDVDGVPYLASVLRLGQSPVYLALALPEQNFTGVFDAISRDAALISLAIVILAVPLIVLVARRLARPLALLARGTERIAQFDLGDAIAPETRIAEIAHLGDSMERMRAALGQISKFVPKTLVQDLVRSGAPLEVGGERREISVLFTDVKDFTTIAESLPAEALMAQMSEYFDAVVRSVLGEHGTVDKYVGDAVFAFWNAPLRQENHETLACRAALAARAASNALNAAWRAQGRPAWHTRFGVHVGEAVIGNVGSSDRLDYTAVGDTVNMGSRLEGLNKFYGTQILVSGPVAARAAGAFVFRPIDLVVAKGATTPLEIFELHADGPTARDVIERWSPVAERVRSRDWRGALVAVTAFLERYPDDGPGRVIADRVERFLAQPPLPTWDGATRFDSK